MFPLSPSAQSLAARTKITFDIDEGPSLRAPGGPSLGGASLFSSSSFHLTIFSFFLLLFCPGEKPLGFGDLFLETSFSILTPVCEEEKTVKIMNEHKGHSQVGKMGKCGSFSITLTFFDCIAQMRLTKNDQQMVKLSQMGEGEGESPTWKNSHIFPFLLESVLEKILVRLL